MLQPVLTCARLLPSLHELCLLSCVCLLSSVCLLSCVCASCHVCACCHLCALCNMISSDGERTLWLSAHRKTIRLHTPLLVCVRCSVVVDVARIDDVTVTAVTSRNGSALEVATVAGVVVRVMDLGRASRVRLRAHMALALRMHSMYDLCNPCVQLTSECLCLASRCRPCDLLPAVAMSLCPVWWRIGWWCARQGQCPAFLTGPPGLT